MSLGVVIKGPEGVVLATDSRVTLEARQQNGPSFHVTFDNATKILSFSKPHNYVAAITYGLAVIGQRTAHSFVPEFELTLKDDERLTVEGYAQRLSEFFLGRWEESSMPKNHEGPPMMFIVGGYDPDSAYGKVFLFGIPNHPTLEPKHCDNNEFGMTWGGQLEIASRLIHGYDPRIREAIRETLNLDDEQTKLVDKAMKEQGEFPIPYGVLPLQDCVDLAAFLIRSTIIAQRLAVAIRGVGGPVEVATITRANGLQYIQKKEIHLEEGIW